MFTNRSEKEFIIVYCAKICLKHSEVHKYDNI